MLTFLKYYAEKELHLDLLVYCGSACSDYGVNVFVWVLIFSVVTSLMPIEREIFLSTLFWQRSCIS